MVQILALPYTQQAQQFRNYFAVAPRSAFLFSLLTQLRSTFKQPFNNRKSNNKLETHNMKWSKYKSDYIAYDPFAAYFSY